MRINEETFKQHVRSLIADGQGIRDSRPPRALIRAYSNWCGQCRNLVPLLGGHSEPWLAQLASMIPGTPMVEDIDASLGTLESILATIEQGLLVRTRDSVRAEVFDDFLDQAKYLQGEGFHVAASVLGRAVLEDHLRNWCVFSNCLPTKPRPMLGDFSIALLKHNAIDGVKKRQIDAMAEIGNCAAHDKNKLRPEDVDRLLRDLPDFLAQNPIS